MPTAITTIETRVRQIVANYVRCDLAKVTPDSTVESLNGDSLDRTEILFELEEEFGFQASDDQAEGLSTVRQLTDFVQAHRAA